MASKWAHRPTRQFRLAEVPKTCRISQLPHLEEPTIQLRRATWLGLMSLQLRDSAGLATGFASPPCHPGHGHLG